MRNFLSGPIKLLLILSGVCSPFSANYFSNPFEKFFHVSGHCDPSGSHCTRYIMAGDDAPEKNEEEKDSELDLLAEQELVRLTRQFRVMEGDKEVCNKNILILEIIF